MQSTHLFDYLLSPVSGVLFVAAFVVSVFLLLTKRGQLSHGQKTVLWLVIAACLLMAALVVWLAIGFGAPSPHPTAQ